MAATPRRASSTSPPASPASSARPSSRARSATTNTTSFASSTTGPLIDGLLAFRLTAFNTDRKGVLANIKTGVAANSVGRSGARLQFLATPTDKLSIRLIGEFSKEDDTCCVSVLTSVIPSSLGGAGTTADPAGLRGPWLRPVPSLDYTQNNAIQNMRTDQKAVSAEANWDLGWADLTSITAWRYWHFDPLQDSDGTPLDIIQVNVATTEDWQWSQEFEIGLQAGPLQLAGRGLPLRPEAEGPLHPEPVRL